MRVQVFVYGTLMPGESGYSVCADQVIEACPAIAIASLYHLPLGYPAIMLERLSSTPAPVVHGVVLSFSSAAVLERLDAYEQHDRTVFTRHAPGQEFTDNQYSRIKFPVFTPEQFARGQLNGAPLGIVWGYVMHQEQIQRLGGVLMRDGDWRRSGSRRLNHPDPAR